jgi:RNA polymerase sigma-70 factor (ECF subfamily)
MKWNDPESIRNCLNGHPDRFKDLVGRYQAGLLAFLHGRIRNREQAEEAAQETFVRAFFSLKRLKKPEAFFSWLLGIAHRVAKEQLRSSKRQEALAKMAKEHNKSPAPEGDPALEEAVASLPDPYREVVLLRFYSGLSCEASARKLGLALGTVTKRLSRAYALLRESLGSSQPSGMEKRCSDEL